MSSLITGFFRRTARIRGVEVLVDRREIVLTEEDGARFFNNLETPDAGSVARLRELRDRA